jgi:hypothetical protein
MAWMKGVAAALLLLALVLALLVALGEARWRRLTRELEAGLASPAAGPARFDAQELEGLPAPVQRYLRAAISEGAPLVRGATLAHEGQFNLSADGERWCPFSSTQRVVTQRPGFVWNGRIALLPGLSVRVHDAYVGGEGRLHAALLGLFALADLRGRQDELARGELMRYLAEAAWYPTALLPSQGVRWLALDARSARATLSDGGVSVSLDFHFSAEDGLVERVRAEARGRSVGTQMQPTPWEGRWSDYQRRDGLLVPQRGVVAWVLPDGERPYWRGRIAALRYHFATTASSRPTATAPF